MPCQPSRGASVTSRYGLLGTTVAVLGTLLLSTSVWAQQTTAGIFGVVRDSSSGVLPGVTVEAASPSLIEKVRSTTADAEGRFNFVDLVPGTYSVTFTLTGFKSLKRDGIT